MIKALIIDFGGVLFPIQPYSGGIKPEREKFNQIKQLVIDIYDENEDKINGKTFSREDFIKEVKEKGNKDFTKEELKAVIKSILNIDEHVLKYIKKAVANYNLYALVNEAPKWTELRAYFHNLDLFFKDYFISVYLGAEKPDPKIFRLFLERTDLNPNECLFIDDKEENINTAKFLGFNTKSIESLLN